MNRRKGRSIYANCLVKARDFSGHEKRSGARAGVPLRLGVLFTVFVIDANVYGPMHFNDEVRYWDIARAIYEGKSPSPRIPITPVLLHFPAAAFYLFSPFTRYAAARWLNAFT